ncbi:alpha/beta fold hydrolase [Methylobacterium sp. E-045]|uniref:alpha/beta fold hydrolase n=1 Tax=Methylobacterium sp. E-045 TaxID=2836575 RepID=UPI001FBAC766|nr:alpha/beta hydrolase [Methylobacterium sp. E-045]MCJ2130674.1 alpha/beta hydrolase [Methylobacterium sp. E-045]
MFRSDQVASAGEATFDWRSVVTDGDVRIRYGVVGSGPRTILLIHGYPETAIAWRKVVGPLAAAGLRVIAPDIRGAGGSSRPQHGYDKRTLAADCAAVLKDVGVDKPVIVVGHDIGLMIAYAFARRYPDRTERLVVMEAPLPGTAVFDQLWRDGPLWHFHFHQAADVPEMLTGGRERYYLERFWRHLAYDTGAIDLATREAYLADYRAPGGMRAGFEWYRAFQQDAADNREALRMDGKLKMPVLALAGEASAVTKLMEPMIREVAEDVAVSIVPFAGHWIPEENPSGFLKELLTFAGLEV